MTKRNKKLLGMILVFVLSLFVMIGRGISQPWEYVVASGLVASTAVTTSMMYTEPRQNRDDRE